MTNINVNIEHSFHKTTGIQEIQSLFQNGNRDVTFIILPDIKLNKKKKSPIRKIYKQSNRQLKTTQHTCDGLTKNSP